MRGLIAGVILLLMFVLFIAADAIGWKWLIGHRTALFRAAEKAFTAF